MSQAHICYPRSLILFIDYHFYILDSSQPCSCFGATCPKLHMNNIYNVNTATTTYCCYYYTITTTTATAAAAKSTSLTVSPYFYKHIFLFLCLRLVSDARSFRKPVLTGEGFLTGTPPISCKHNLNLHVLYQTS